MYHRLRSLLICGGAVLCFASQAIADEHESVPEPGQVLATVNGIEITLGHVIALREDLPPQYDQFPPELLLRAIVDQLIQHTLLMQSVEGDPSPRTQINIENEIRALIAGDVLAGIIEQTPSEAELLALYDAEYPEDPDAKEYRASHILVETEEKAAELISELEGGASFAQLAREHSTGPSGEAGGDLGWFSDGDMVEPFFDAVVALSPGEVSPPVQTQFGWHVVSLAETRQMKRPELETVQQQLIEQFRQNRVETVVAELRDQADVTEADIGAIDPTVITNYELLEQ